MRKSVLFAFASISLLSPLINLKGISGIAFQPYIGQWSGSSPTATVPAFNSYTESDVDNMLNTVDDYFTSLTTYSSGGGNASFH